MGAFWGKGVAFESLGGLDVTLETFEGATYKIKRGMWWTLFSSSIIFLVRFL